LRRGDGLAAHARPPSWIEIIRKRLRPASNFVASKMQLGGSMKSPVHEVVKRLLELHVLEERLAALQRSHENTRDVEALMASLREKLPVSALIDHDRLHARGKRSVAEVRHGVCSGCHLGLAIGNVNALKTGVLRRCGNCGRYLYAVEEASAPTPAPTTARRLRQAWDKSTATRSQVK
jgi:hypothetical protein